MLLSMVFQVFMIRWLSPHALCYPPKPCSSSVPDMMICLQFPELATFLQSGPLCLERPSLYHHPPFAPFPLYSSLTSTHLADSHSPFRAQFMHHFLLEACQDSPTESEGLIVPAMCYQALCMPPPLHFSSVL